MGAYANPCVGAHNISGDSRNFQGEFLFWKLRAKKVSATYTRTFSISEAGYILIDTYWHSEPPSLDLLTVKYLPFIHSSIRWACAYFKRGFRGNLETLPKSATEYCTIAVETLNGMNFSTIMVKVCLVIGIPTTQWNWIQMTRWVLCVLNMDSIACYVSPQAWPDFAVNREIANLKVKCENYMVGCDWTGLFKELMVHFV